MDLGNFYETAATVSPILLGGTVLALSRLPRPRSRWREKLISLFLLLPPLVVTLWSLSVLAGESSAETWRLPVLWLLQLQVLTGLAGLAGLGFASPSQRRSVDEWWRREDKERRRDRRLGRLHSQPHEPGPTAPDEAQQPPPPDQPDRTGPHDS